MTKEEWIERCYQQYLHRWLTNERKSRLAAEATFNRLDDPLSTVPEDEAKADLTWDG
jgi:hypothetical protein